MPEHDQAGLRRLGQRDHQDTVAAAWPRPGQQPGQGALQGGPFPAAEAGSDEYGALDAFTPPF